MITAAKPARPASPAAIPAPSVTTPTPKASTAGMRPATGVTVPTPTAPPPPKPGRIKRPIPSTPTATAPNVATGIPVTPIAAGTTTVPATGSSVPSPAAPPRPRRPATPSTETSVMSVATTAPSPRPIPTTMASRAGNIGVNAPTRTARRRTAGSSTGLPTSILMTRTPPVTFAAMSVPLPRIIPTAMSTAIGAGT